MFKDGFTQDTQITYSGMIWLLAAQLVIMAPLMFFLPIWLFPVLIFSAGWRIRVMQGHQTQPGTVLKAVIALIGVAALSVSGLKVISLDMMASLLLLGFAYKALEVIERRDAMVIILTGFILIGVLFLFSQSMFISLYGVFALAVLTGALVAIQQSKSYATLPNLKLSSMMLFLCLPLMLVLFIFAPRFSPLWTLPMSGGESAQTGISDSMTPGDIAELSKSDELAFSVTFSGERPKQNELYWRGLVMQNFDGKTWKQFEEKLTPRETRSRLRINRQALRNKLVQKGKGMQYQVIYEKTAQPWLFTLAPVVDVSGRRTIFANDFTVMARRELFEPTMFRFASYTEALREVELTEQTRLSALQLPKGENPQTRALATSIYQRSRSNEDYVNRVMNRFTQQEYFYTLRPNTMGEKNTIDEFLINQKKGFCAHYAGSFVYMMRAVGIPARVVTGYQGGKWNEQGQFLSVRQYDAHAWTEVWLENRGWVRYDPTSMVAPSRIEKNLESAVEEEGSFLEDQMFSMAKHSWLNGLKSKYDSMQFAWRKLVVGYDKESRAELLKRLFGELNVQKIATLVGGSFIAIFAVWMLLLGLGRKEEKEAKEHRLYRRFCDQLEKLGVKREPSQGPSEFSKLASAQLPNHASHITNFTNIYSDLCYNPDAHNNMIERLAALESILSKMKRKKA